MKINKESVGDLISAAAQGQPQGAITVLTGLLSVIECVTRMDQPASEEECAKKVLRLIGDPDYETAVRACILELLNHRSELRRQLLEAAIELAKAALGPSGDLIAEKERWITEHIRQLRRPETSAFLCECYAKQTRTYLDRIAAEDSAKFGESYE